MVPRVGRPKTVKPPSLPEFFKGIFFGAAGVGKTHLFGTMGKGAKILILDVEGGSVTYSSPPFLNDEAATEPENIDVVEFPTEGPERIQTAQELVHLIEGTFDWLIRTRNEDGYDLVVVDSLTEFQARFIKMHGANDPRQSYGAMADALHEIVLKARAAPVHVVFSSRPRSVEDEETGEEIVRADIAPSAWKSVSGLLDAVAYYKARTQGAKTTRVLDFSHSNRFQAKNRYGLTELKNPTMKGILEVIQQRSEATPPKQATHTATPRRVTRPNTPAKAA